MIIRKINNQEIKKGQDYFQILEDLSGKRVMLTIYDPSTKKGMGGICETDHLRQPKRFTI